MSTAERIHEKIARGAHGFLFWLGVQARAEYVEKTVTYHFPDGSRLIRRDVDTDNETIQAEWPTNRPMSSSIKSARAR